MSQTETAGKKSGNKVIVILLCVIVVALIAVLAVILLKKDKPDSDKPVLEVETQLVTASDTDLNALLAEMQSKVDQGMISVKYNDLILFPDGTSEGSCSIVNPEDNNYPMVFSLSLTDTGEEVYRSKLIPLGMELQTLKLTKDLDAGDHPAILTYHAMNEETGEEMSTVSVTVTVQVQA